MKRKKEYMTPELKVIMCEYVSMICGSKPQNLIPQIQKNLTGIIIEILIIMNMVLNKIKNKLDTKK